METWINAAIALIVIVWLALACMFCMCLREDQPVHSASPHKTEPDDREHAEAPDLHSAPRAS